MASRGKGSHAVVAALDGTGAAEVLALWRRLEGAGIEDVPSRLGVRPHVTLAILPGGEAEESLEGALRDLAARHAPVPLRFTALAFFPTSHHEDYYFLAPAASQELLALHADLHDLLRRLGLEASPHTLPGAWTPHCSLTEGVKERRAGEVIERLQDRWQPIVCQAAELALVTFPPAQERLTLPLSGG